MTDTISVEVAYACPERQELIQVTLPAGSTAMDAISASGICTIFPDIDTRHQSIGVFGRILRQPAHHELSDGDRVEIYRPLKIDPKDARAARAGTQRRGG